MKTTLILTISLLSVNLLMGQTDGELLYKKKCASCHGTNGEKKALHVSRILNTLDKQEIVNALLEYKNGTYSGKFKSLKRGLAGKLREDEINTVAAYVQTLRVLQ